MKSNINNIMDSGIIGEYQYKILMGPLGSINGYVGIPPEKEKLLDLNLEDFIKVHGGITFEQSGEYPSRKIKADASGNIKYVVDNITFEAPYYWIGFDTAHYGDGVDTKEIEKYFDREEAEELIKIRTGGINSSTKIWTKDLVFYEILLMVNQLIELEKEDNEDA